MPTRDQVLQSVFNALERAACAGVRCPVNDELSATSRSAVPALAYRGLIRVEVYGHNYRVVEILDGPHKGKRTQAAPKGYRPYKVIDKGGARYVGAAGRRREHSVAA